jgi:hypothetical protein
MLFPTRSRTGLQARKIATFKSSAKVDISPDSPALCGYKCFNGIRSDRVADTRMFDTVVVRLDLLP